MRYDKSGALRPACLGKPWAPGQRRVTPLARPPATQRLSYRFRPSYINRKDFP